MNCKNCENPLAEGAVFCQNCGARVVTQRLTLKSMWKDYCASFFGWDNKFFLTFKTMLLQPQKVLEDYINGVRKRYVNPVTFFVIGMTISLLIFNQFADSYVAASQEINEMQLKMMMQILPQDEKTVGDIEAYKQEQMAATEQAQLMILKYYNFYTFLLLPFYTFLSFMTYRKPYNYAEHLIFNAYIQGVTFFTGTVFFILGLLISPSIMSVSILFVMLYYLYAFSKMWRHDLAEAILRLMKFFLVLLGSMIVIFVVGVIIGIMISF